MAVPTHFRFNVRGHFTGTPEFWQTGAHFSRDAPLATDAGLDDLNESAITSAVTAFFGSAKFNTDVCLDDWRMYVIGTDGKMEGNGPLLHTFPPNTYKGTGSTPRYPPQVALVATLVATDRGPAQFGRMYLPPPNTTLQSSDLRISATDALTWATDIGAFLKAISDAIDLQGVGTSAVGLNISPGPAGSTTGTKQTIDHVEVGRVLDTLRNRRKSLIESRAVGGHLDW